MKKSAIYSLAALVLLTASAALLVSPAQAEAWRETIVHLIVRGELLMPDATTAAKGIVMGGDAALYRGAADTLRTPDSFTSDVTVTAADVAATDDLTVGDDATVTDALTAADLIATDDVTVGDDLTVTDAVAAVSVAASGAITAATVATTGSILSSGTTGVGYTTGAGGTVTQGVSKATTVVLSERSGTITLHAAELAAGALVSFTCTNTTVSATDYVAIQHDSVGAIGSYTVQVTPGAGSFVVNVRNITAGNLSEAIVLRFIAFEGVTS